MLHNFLLADEKVVKLTFNEKQWSHNGKAVQKVDLPKFNADIIEIHAASGTKMEELKFITEYFRFELQIKTHLYANDKKNLFTKLSPIHVKSQQSLVTTLQTIIGNAGNFDPHSINIFVQHNEHLASPHSEGDYKIGDDPENFITVNRQYHQEQNANTAYLFGISPTTTLEQFIEAHKTIRNSGVNQLIPVVDAMLGECVQVIKLDPDVKPAVAFNDPKKDPNKTRIQINIIGDGTYKTSEGKIINSPEDLTTYIAAQNKKITANNNNPVLHLIGHKKTVFAESQEAIVAAAEAGVNQIIFSIGPKK